MVRWFTKRKNPSLRHPFFAHLELINGVWSGEIDFAPIERRVCVFIEDEGGGPVDGASKAIREFEERFKSLRPAFSIELRKLLEPWHKEFWNNAEPLPAGEELFGLFELETIEVVSRGINTVYFALRQGWDDASFRVSLENWTPKGLGIDD
jgi:hypothetical protein